MTTNGFVNNASASFPSISSVVNERLIEPENSSEIDAMTDMVIKLIKLNKTPLTYKSPYFKTMRDCNMQIALSSSNEKLAAYRAELEATVCGRTTNKELYQLLLSEIDKYANLQFYYPAFTTIPVSF